MFLYTSSAWRLKEKIATLKYSDGEVIYRDWCAVCQDLQNTLNCFKKNKKGNKHAKKTKRN